MYLHGDTGTIPKYKILHGFALQQNYYSENLHNKIRLLPFQSGCTRRLCFSGHFLQLRASEVVRCGQRVAETAKLTLRKE